MTALKSFSPKNFTPLLEIKVLCLRWDFYRFPLGFSIYANKGGGRGLQGFFPWKVNFNFTHIYLSLISCICAQKNLSQYQKLNFCSYWGTLNIEFWPHLRTFHGSSGLVQGRVEPGILRFQIDVITHYTTARHSSSIIYVTGVLNVPKMNLIYLAAN